MATLSSIRQKQKAVLWALLTLFILSLSIGGLVGGANIVDQIFGSNLNGDAVGAVNRDRITADELSRAISAQTQQAREQFGELNDRLMEQVENQAWDNLVIGRLLSAELTAQNLGATGDEIFYVLQNYPPAFLQQNDGFQTDGEFDPSKYFQALNNASGNEWVPVENYLSTLLPGEKMTFLIRAMAYTSEEEVKANWFESQTRATVDYIYLAQNSIDQDEIVIPEADLRALYRRQREDYTRSETRVLQYVYWPKTATASDTADVLETAADLVSRADAGEDFAQLALDYSEDPGSGPNGGELGWFGRGQMVSEFEAAAFEAQPGEVAGPVRTQFGFHVIKVHDRREAENGPEVNASHILLKVELSPGGSNDLRNQANIFSFDAIDSSFSAAVRIHGMEAHMSPGLSEPDKYLPPPVGMLRSAVRFAFQAEVGDIADVFSNESCFLVARLDEVRPAGYQSFEEVKFQLERTLKQEATADQVGQTMAGIPDQLASGESWQGVADSIPGAFFHSGATTSLDGGFPGIGRSTMLAGVIMTLSPGETSPVMQLERGQVVVRLVDLAEPDWSLFDTEREAAHQNLYDRRVEAAWNRWLQDLKNQAEIIDNRHRFF
ncbi:MAG: peptidylprolyl isomerase [Candidatus Neomarinimicrobiota bacterium]